MKKTIGIENIGFFMGPAENRSSTIYQIEHNWLFYFIYKALEQSAIGPIF